MAGEPKRFSAEEFFIYCDMLNFTSFFVGVGNVHITIEKKPHFFDYVKHHDARSLIDIIAIERLKQYILDSNYELVYVEENVKNQEYKFYCGEFVHYGKEPIHVYDCDFILNPITNELRRILCPSRYDRRDS